MLRRFCNQTFSQTSKLTQIQQASAFNWTWTRLT